MSNAIMERRIKHNPNTYVVGNGSLIPKEFLLNKQNHNVVLLIGNIRNWIDFKLLDFLITSRQEYLFRIVGPHEKSIKK